jgi:Fe-S cluster biogenesis protein NfuA
MITEKTETKAELTEGEAQPESTNEDGDLMALDLASMEEGIIEAIEAIRPALQSDGGDIVFQGVDEDGVVQVALVGACGTCPVSMMTLKAGVERIIMDRVPGVTEVIAAE